jgi:hypothetical protein
MFFIPHTPCLQDGGDDDLLSMIKEGLGLQPPGPLEPMACDVNTLVEDFREEWALPLEHCHEGPLSPSPPPQQQPPPTQRRYKLIPMPNVTIMPRRPSPPPEPKPQPQSLLLEVGLHLCNKDQIQPAFARLATKIQSELQVAVAPAKVTRAPLPLDRGFDYTAIFDVSMPHPMRLKCVMDMGKKGDLHSAYLDWYRVYPDNHHQLLALEGAVLARFHEAFATRPPPGTLLPFLQRNCKLSIRLRPIGMPY